MAAFKKSPSCLRLLCLENTARNIQFWCRDKDEELANYKYILGPFDSLNTEQVHQVLRYLVAHRQLKLNYLHLLFHCNITGVDLSACYQLVSDKLLRMLMTRCKKIGWMNLDECNKLSTKVLLQIPANFPQLRSLSLKHVTACKDVVLEQLGEHCPHLQALHVPQCKITDGGLISLCGTEQQPGCHKLTDIDLSETDVGNVGVEVILQLQPKLSRLSVGNTLWSPSAHILPRIPPKVQLKCIDLSHLQITDDVFKGILKLCPSLVDVDISNCPRLTESAIQACEENLPCLLHFRADHSAEDMSIIKRVPKLLEIHGSSLKTLHLSFVELSNLSTIILNCMSLETLVLHSCITQVSSVSLGSLKAKWGVRMRPELLTKGQVTLCETNPLLQHLNISCIDLQGENASMQLGFLLNNSCHFKTLDLSYLSTITDQVITSFIETSDLSSLAVLNLAGCDNVTVVPLQILLSLSPRLRSLNLSYCKSVTRMDYDSLVLQTERAGQATRINWF